MKIIVPLIFFLTLFTSLNGQISDRIKKNIDLESFPKIGIGVQESPEIFEKIKVLKHKAKNDIRYKIILGDSYKYTKNNCLKAFKLYDEGYQEGYLPAYHRVAFMYKEGCDVKVDNELFIKILKECSDLKSFDCIHDLAVLYYYGDIVEKDIDRSEELLLSIYDKNKSSLKHQGINIMLSCIYLIKSGMHTGRDKVFFLEKSLKHYELTNFSKSKAKIIKEEIVKENRSIFKKEEEKRLKKEEEERLKKEEEKWLRKTKKVINVNSLNILEKALSYESVHFKKNLNIITKTQYEDLFKYYQTHYKKVFKNVCKYSSYKDARNESNYQEILSSDTIFEKKRKEENNLLIEKKLYNEYYAYYLDMLNDIKLEDFTTLIRSIYIRSEMPNINIFIDKEKYNFEENYYPLYIMIDPDNEKTMDEKLFFTEGLIEGTEYGESYFIKKIYSTEKYGRKKRHTISYFYLKNKKLDSRNEIYRVNLHPSLRKTYYTLKLFVNQENAEKIYSLLSDSYMAIDILVKYSFTTEKEDLIKNYLLDESLIKLLKYLLVKEVGVAYENEIKLEKTTNPHKYMHSFFQSLLKNSGN